MGEIDPNGTLTSSPKYDVYGGVRSNSGTASSKMGFVGGLGHLSEANTGLIYMRARYYDPSNGRFSSQDPDLQDANWFVYCNNNPVNNVDENGKWLRQIGAVVAAVFAWIGGLDSVTAAFVRAATAILALANSIIIPALEGIRENSELEANPSSLNIWLKYNVQVMLAGTAAGAALGAIAAIYTLGLYMVGVTQLT